MRQLTGDRSLVTLVNGTDNYDHFYIVDKPNGRLNNKDFEVCDQDAQIKRRVLYEGVDANNGKRY